MLSQLMNVDINGNIKEDEKEDDTVNGPWSELRLDLLTLVFSCLSFVDQPAFLCSCKSWRLAVLAGGEHHIKQLWLTEKVVSRERVGRTFKSTTNAQGHTMLVVLHFPYCQEWLGAGGQAGRTWKVTQNHVLRPFTRTAIKSMICPLRSTR